MKKSIKKIISISLAIILLLSALSISAFALEHEDFDVNDLTLNDLSKMSVPELEQVLADFERVYDPFHTYKTKPLAKLNQKPNYPTQPLWTSGDITSLQYNGVHTKFEEFVNEHMDNLMENPYSLPYQKYLDMCKKSLNELIYEPTKEAKSLINTVDANDKSQW